MAFALLTPVILLALLAGVALVRDWRAARREAVTHAQELASATAERVIRFLDHSATNRGSASSEKPLLASEAVDGFTIGSSNELISPRPPSWPPQPQPLALDLSGSNEVAWATARAAFLGGDWESAISQYEAFLKAPDPSVDAAASTGDNRGSHAARYRVIAMLERAISLDHAGPTNELAEEFNQVLEQATSGETEPITEAGIPAAQLAALRVLDAADQRVDRLPDSWRRDPFRLVARLAETSPTPYLAEFFQRLRPLIPSLLAPFPNRSEQGLLDAVGRAERSRARYREALGALGPVVPWPDAFWINAGPTPWLAVVEQTDNGAVKAEEGSGDEQRLGPGRLAGSSRRFSLFPRTGLVEILDAVTRDLDRERAFLLRLAIAGRSVTGNATTSPAPPPAPASPDLASVTATLPGSVSVNAGVALVDPATFYAAQRQRILTFAGLLVVALFAAVWSILATRRSLQRQHELNVQKSNFVSAVSHELRAPLGSIRLLAEGLERGTVADESRRQEYFRLMGQETRRLGALIENVLDFSRIEQGRKSYEFEPTAILALVRGTVALAEPLALVRGVCLEMRVTSGGDGPWELFADGRALQQALLNLLDNALKHSPSGERVVVEMSRTLDGHKPEVRIAVADRGPGIPEAEHQRIFEPFYRRGSELRRETPGIGIGLSIVRHVIAAHHGRVEVESRPGNGARFSLVLPATPDLASSQPGDRGGAEDTSGAETPLPTSAP